MAKRAGGQTIGFDVDEDDSQYEEMLAEWDKKKETETDAMTEIKLHEMEKT